MDRTVLIIDDDPMNLRMAEIILKKKDYKVIKAESGQAGLEMLQSEAVDLVLLDVEMPGMNGVETLDAIRRLYPTEKMPVLFLSASETAKEAVEAGKYAVQGLVEKPILPQKLYESVELHIMDRVAEPQDIPPRILVVDDDNMNLKIAGNILKRKFMVECVNSGMKALEYLTDNIPDLILLDIHMPDMDGFEVMRKLQSNSDYSSIPVIFLTADDDRDTEVRCFKEGAYDFIIKPFVADIMMQRVDRILQLDFLQKKLQNEVEKQTRRAEDRRRKVERMSLQIMRTLAGTIDAKDKYTNGHSGRVAEYSRNIARRAGKSEKEQESIYYMGLLHDIGKIGIPDDIINKTSRLTDEEYAVIKTHPVIGSDILMNISELPDIAIGARYHHERYDGKGYPDRLAGEEIPEFARIIAVADSYDAMTSNRAYRTLLSQDVVRSEIEKGKGNQFDPYFADIMLAMIDEDTDYNMHEKEN